jgi:hypothetical protein
MQNSPPAVSQNQEHVQHLEPDGRNGEEVDRHHGLDVILKEGAPSLGGRFPAPDQVLAHAGLADVDAELEQFTGDRRQAITVSGLTMTRAARHSAQSLDSLAQRMRTAADGFGRFAERFRTPSWCRRARTSN